MSFPTPTGFAQPQPFIPQTFIQNQPNEVLNLNPQQAASFSSTMSSPFYSPSPVPSYWPAPSMPASSFPSSSPVVIQQPIYIPVYQPPQQPESAFPGFPQPSSAAPDPRLMEMLFSSLASVFGQMAEPPEPPPQPQQSLPVLPFPPGGGDMMSQILPLLLLMMLSNSDDHQDVDTPTTPSKPSTPGNPDYGNGEVTPDSSSVEQEPEQVEPEYENDNYNGYSGGTWGDPHFKDLTNPTASRYVTDFDVKGEVGKTYNILSDKTIQFNSTFVAGDPTIGTIMGQMGIKLKEDLGNETRVEFDAITGVAKLDGQVMTEGQKKEMVINGKPATVEFKGGKVYVVTNEYNIEMMKSPDGNHGDQIVTIEKDGVMRDWVNPHGLLGQTADGDKNIRKGTGINGEGAIDFTYKNYEVADLFSNPEDRINRFGIRTRVVRDRDGNALRLFDENGRLLAMQDKDGKMVSVRYTEDDQGQITMFLADGITKVDDQGNFIEENGNSQQAA